MLAFGRAGGQPDSLRNPDDGVARVGAGEEPVGAIDRYCVAAKAVGGGPGVIADGDSLPCQMQSADDFFRGEFFLSGNRVGGDLLRVSEIFGVLGGFAAQALEPVG